MKRNRWKLSGILAMVAVLLTMTMAAVPVTTVEAATKDVTAKMSRDKKLKKVCRMVTSYTTAMELSTEPGSEKSEKLTTVKLNNANRLSIAAFIRFHEKGDVGYTTKELKKTTKDLFGKTANINKKYVKPMGKTSMLVCSSDKRYVSEPYMYCGGEFGDMEPRFRIQKIVQTGRKTYEITAENRVGVYGEKGTEKIGTTVLMVKKTSGKGYGYMVKKIRYQ